MAQSILDKLGTLVKGKLHGLLNRAIDENSMDVVAQYIREMEDARDETKKALASARADVTIVNEDIKGLQGLAAKAEAAAEQLLSDDDPSNDDWAKPHLKKQEGYLEQVTEKQEELTGLTVAVTAVEKTLALIVSKHDAMLKQYHKLETAERTAAAQEKAAKAIEQVGTIDTSGVEKSVDNISERIRKRAAVAQEKLAMATSSSDPGSDAADDAVVDSQVNQRMAEMRARIAAKKAAAGGAPTPGAA